MKLIVGDVRMSGKVNIKEILAQKKPIIDDMVRHYFPEQVTTKDLIRMCGVPRYEFDENALNKAVFEPMWDFLKVGGKRWRPVLFLLLIEALGGKDADRYINYSIIPELVHNGTLVIDDIEDDSPTRRGMPAAHIKHGVDIAVNFGNALYYLPLLPLMENKEGLNCEIITKIYGIYGREMINLSMGQAMDIYWHNGHADNVTEKQYLQMCAFKTGTLARMSAKIAATLANADEKAIDLIGEYAETIGVAFQIQDDVLNLTADSNKAQFTDEYVGSDITEGKRTLMVIHTLQEASAEDRQRLTDILNQHTKDKAIIREAIDLIKKYDSVNYAKKFGKDMMTGIWDRMNGVLKEGQARDALESFTMFLIERDY